MSNFYEGLFYGVLFTLIFCLTFFNNFSEQAELIEECEKTIPRNQNCELKAVVNEGIKND